MATWKQKAPRAALRILASLLFILTCVSIFLLLYQPKMIYFPHRYNDAELSSVPDELVTIEYKTSQGAQQAYYLPPKAGGDPAFVWMVFSGNATVALDWIDYSMNYPATDAGVLLFDYPGYGRCEGRPNPKTILESSHGALAALRTHIPAWTPEGRLGILGHSLGAAAALQFAVEQPPQRLILIAPFTSLRDMARRAVGWPLCYLLLHNFNNRARLSEILRIDNPPRVTIIHGEMDQVVPAAMGRALADAHPGKVTYLGIPTGDHNDILHIHQGRIFEAMGGTK